MRATRFSATKHTKTTKVFDGPCPALRDVRLESRHDFSEEPRHDAAELIRLNGLSVGQRIGPYSVLAKLGAGGMGEVYRAHDTQLGRDVAIKILPLVFADDPDRLARFEREARIVASLNHPHIAAIYGIETETGRPPTEERIVRALVMELIEGPTLADRIAHGPLPVAEALEFARQIADALEAAHEKGIVHRDLKPANIKLTAEGVLKVLDFGLAKAPIQVPGPPDLSTLPTMTMPAETSAGMVLGTAEYMAPEQARGKPVDKRADVWAFGCVLYEMLTGKRAFAGDEAVDVLARIIDSEPDFTHLPRATPPAVRRLIGRCLTKNPRWRLPDIAMARIELEDARTSAPESVAVPTTARRIPASVMWLGAVAALAGVAVLTALTIGGRAPEALLTRLEITTPATYDPASFALSPDGRQLAFVANVDGRPLLWIRPLDDVTARPIAGTEGASAPFWSPSGDAIGFFARGKLKTIDVRGGAAKELADASSGRGGTWSREDVIVFAPQTGLGLMRVSANGGEATAATSLAPDQGSHRWPQFLPDGRQFLFYSAQGEPSGNGVYLASLDGNVTRRLSVIGSAAVYADPGYLLHVSNGVLFANRFDATRGEISGEAVPLAQSVGTREGAFRDLFSVSETGVLAHRVGTGARRQLTWVDREGKTIGVINQPDDAVPSAPELSPDERRVTVMRGAEGVSDIWVLDTTRPVQNRLTLHGGNLPIWSTDGLRIFFRTAAGLFEKPSNGIGDQQSVMAGSGVVLDHSSDGRHLLYAADSDLRALPLTGSRESFAVAEGPFDEGQGQFSPDDKWVAYASNANDSARHQIFVRAFPGPGEAVQVSTDGGIYPRWRPDGNEIFYVAPDGRLMAAPIRTDQSPPVAETPVALFQTILATGAYILESGINARAQYDVTRDGRFLMNNGVEDVGAPITIVLNWTTLLTK